MSSGPQAEREAKWTHIEEEEGGDDDDDDEVSGGRGGVRFEETELGAKDIEELLRGIGGTRKTDASDLGLDVSALEGLKRDTPFAPNSQPYYEEEIQRLRSENSHLKQYAARIQDELGRWVRKFDGVSPFEMGEEDQDGNDGGNAPGEGSVSPWVATPHIFSPLLMSYDARISELRSIATNAEKQLAEDREHIARLTQENERLQSDLEAELDDNIRKIENAPGKMFNVGETGMGGPSSSNLHQVGLVANESITMLNNLVETLQKENAILQERDIILNRDVERLTEQGKERDLQLMKIAQNFQSASLGLKQAKEQLSEFSQERDSALNQLNHATSQLNDISLEFEKVQGSLAEKDQENKDLMHHIDKLRIEIGDLAALQDAEADLMEKRIQAAEKRVRKVQRELDSERNAHNTLKQIHQEMAVKYESCKQDFDNISTAMQGLKVQIHEYKSQEANVKQLEKEATDLVDRANLERDQALALATARKDEIGRLHKDRTIVAKENISLRENAIRDVKAQVKSQLVTRAAEIEELEQKCTRFALEVERAKSDKYEAINRLEAIRKTSASEMKRLETNMGNLSSRVEEAEEKAIEREAQAQQRIQEATARIAESEQERAALLESTQNLRNQVQQLNAQLELDKNEMKRLAKDAEASDKDAVRVRQELANLRVSSDSRIESIEQRAKLDQTKLSQAASQAETKVSELQQDLDALKQQLDRQNGHHEEELASTVAHFERLVSEQREETTRLRARSEELSAQLNVLQHERTEMSSLIKDYENKVRKLDQALHKSNRQTSESKAQLSELLISEEKRVRELSELRRKIDSSEIAMNRAIRERDAVLKTLDDRNNPTRNVMIADDSFLDDIKPLRRSAHAPMSPSSRSSRLRLEMERS